jgi:superfamily II DNA or RNA helicase
MVLERVIKPYPYQVPVISTVKATLVIRDFVLFVMAMGLGKTVTSAFIVEDYLREGKRGLFLCHETYILEQVEEEYRMVLGNDFVYKTFYGSEINGKKDWNADQADMLFASFQSMNNWHEKWYLAFDPDHFDFMVVDESHHGQAPSYKEVIDYFQCKKIGMTATPDRMDLKDIREIFGEEVYTITLEEGIANGWLAGIEYHVLSDGINNAKLKKICEGVFEKGKRVSVKQLNETIFIRDRDKAEKEIIDEYSKIKEVAGNKKTLLFCERTVHADNLIVHFNRSGVMHSKKTFKENDEVFNAFKDGDLQYVASVNKFNEGKHVPGVEVIVFLRATDSLTIFWQQLGRALAKIGNKAKIIVLDFVSNLERLIQVRDLMLRVVKAQEELEKTTKKKLPLDEHSINVTGENFEFIFSDEIVETMKLIEALRKGYYQTWEEASDVVERLNIKSIEEYGIHYKKDPRLHSRPHILYYNFPGWLPFLKKETTDTNWISRHNLSEKYQIAPSTLDLIVDQFRSTHLEWFRNFSSKNGNSTEYYHIKLDEKLKIIFSVRHPLPEGWVTIGSFSKKNSIASSTLRDIIEPFQYKHSEWFKIFWIQGRVVESFSPELVAIVKKNLKKRLMPPSDWLTKEAFINLNSLTVNPESLQRIIDPIILKHPRWGKVFWKKCRFVKHYHPNLFGMVKNLLDESRKIPPLNWLTAEKVDALFKDSGILCSPAFIKLIAEKFRKKFLGLFGTFWTGNMNAEFYHPHLVQKIKAELITLRNVPIGWKNASVLAKELPGKNYKKTIKRFTEEFQKSNHEWFKDFMTRSIMSEHYHPDLVQKIKEHFAKKK